MFTSRHAAVALTALCIAFALYVESSTGPLPLRLATHFDATGQPNSWMPRDVYAKFITVVGTGMSLLPAFMAFLLRIIPISLVNIPNRAFWLSGERASSTMDYLRRHMIVLGYLILSLVTAVHWSTVRANLAEPPRMMTSDIIPIIGGFVVAMLAWGITLTMHFARKPPAQGGAWFGRAKGPT